MVAFGVLTLASACAPEQPRESIPEASLAAAGPWVPEFEESLRDASPFETAILRDGVITAAELEEAQERKRVCMLDAGIRWKIFDDGTAEGKPVDGSALGSTEDVNATLQRCSRQFDRSVTYLFNEVRRNPEKQDDATITVACLRDAGVVGADYTERRWREENDSGAFAFNQWDPAATQCRLDPLGLWRR